MQQDSEKKKETVLQIQTGGYQWGKEKIEE